MMRPTRLIPEPEPVCRWNAANPTPMLGTWIDMVVILTSSDTNLHG